MRFFPPFSLAENGGFVCTQRKVSEAECAAISYLNAAVTLWFYTPDGKVSEIGFLFVVQ